MWPEGLEFDTGALKGLDLHAERSCGCPAGFGVETGLANSDKVISDKTEQGRCAVTVITGKPVRLHQA